MYGRTSRPYIIVRGLKTGGSLSCLLWIVYINDLLVEMKKVKGVKINRDLNIGKLAFADDLITTRIVDGLVNAKKAQKEFIVIAFEWARKNNMLFNFEPNKTH